MCARSRQATGKGLTSIYESVPFLHVTPVGKYRNYVHVNRTGTPLEYKALHITYKHVAVIRSFI